MPKSLPLIYFDALNPRRSEDIDAMTSTRNQNDQSNGNSSLQPPHYRIPQESGYFPACSDELNALVAKIDNAKLYRINPAPRHGKLSDEPLTAGTLTLHDPAAGTADEVALVCQCGDTIFYVMNDDAVTKTSDSGFILMLPKDCIVMDLAECLDSDRLQVEALLAARTKFHDEAAIDESQTSAIKKNDYPGSLPDDFVSKNMFRASVKVAQLTVSAAEIGASKIDAYGEKKKEKVTEREKDVKVGKTSIMLAKGTRNVSEKVYTVTERVSGKISDVLGGKVGRAAAIKEGDSGTKKKARSFLLASTISYAEIGQGASEGYELMVKSAQAQATSYVAKKYGKEAAELARHTAGAAANFGRAALTAQRVVDVKKLVKSAGKQMVKETIKNSI